MPSYPVRAIKNNNKLYVLRNTEMPSIILEYGYMTNPDDIALLQQDAILQQLAEVTEKAIYEYIMNK
jgi:N-acetylmuramoyl-L-alanine amidase